jgi:putative ABC transport system substrate-binding protein
MRKKSILLASIALLFALSSYAEAQQAKKVPLIGYVSARDSASDSGRSEAIRLALRDLGYIEGQNIAFEYRYGQGNRERFRELAAELVRLKVDIIVVAGGDALVRPVMNATKTIPIIMTGGGDDPVEAGFVKSLARPGGNVTGITLLVLEQGGKRLELLKKPFPKSPISRLSTSRPIRAVSTR